MEKSIWGNSVFRSVLIAQFVSGVGDKLLFFIIPLWVLQTTQSPFLVSVISASTTIVIIMLSPFMGTFVDRLPKRYLMMTADLFRFFLVMILGFLTFFTEFHFGYLLFIYILYTASSSLYSPASDVSLTLIVKEEHMRDAVSLRQTSNQIENLIGPMLGGLLLAVISSPGLIMIGDAICFMMGAIILLFTRYPHDIVQSKEITIGRILKKVCPSYSRRAICAY